MTQPRHPTQRPTLTAERIDDATEVSRTSIWQREFAEAGGAFCQAFQYAAIGMAIVGLDGRFLKLNRSFCRIVGYDEAELLALDFQAITHADDLGLDVSLARQLRDGEIDHYDLEKRYLHKDGSILWVQLSGSIVRDENGQPCYFIAQIQDITVRKQAELESGRRLRQMERLTTTVSQLMGEIDGASDDEHYARWLRILMESFESPAGLLVLFDGEDTVVTIYAHETGSRRLQKPAQDCWASWKSALESRRVIAENTPRRMSCGRVVARSLVGPLIHDDVPLGWIAVGDAAADYDDDVRDLLGRVTRMIAPVVHARQKRAALTPREREVMELLVEGMSQKQIAAALDISVQTAAKHRARLLDKLQIKNDVELVHLALRMQRPAAVHAE